MLLESEQMNDWNQELQQYLKSPQTIQKDTDRDAFNQRIQKIIKIIVEIDNTIFSEENIEAVNVLKGQFLTIMGSSQQQLNQYVDAESTLKSAHFLLKDQETVGAAKMYYHYGWLVHTLKRYPEAEQYYKSSLDLYTKLGIQLYAIDVADVHNNLGRTYDLRNLLTEATEHYLQAINLKKSLPETEDTKNSLANTYNNLAWIKQKQGLFQDAFDLYESALKTSIESAGQLRGTIYNNLGEVSAKLNQPKEAKDFFELALKTKIKTHGDNSDKVAFTLNAYGSFLLAYSDEAPKALELFNSAAKIYSMIFPNNPSHPDLLIAQGNIKKAAQLTGQKTSMTENPNTLFHRQMEDENAPHNQAPSLYK